MTHHELMNDWHLIKDPNWCYGHSRASPKEMLVRSYWPSETCLTSSSGTQWSPLISGKGQRSKVGTVEALCFPWASSWPHLRNHANLLIYRKTKTWKIIPSNRPQKKQQQHDDFPTDVPISAMFFFQEQAASRSGENSQVDGVCELLGMAWKVLKMTEFITWVPQLLESLCLGCLGCLPWGCLEPSFVDRIRELSNANDWIAFSQQNNRITFLWTSWWSFFAKELFSEAGTAALTAGLARRNCLWRNSQRNADRRWRFFFLNIWLCLRIEAGWWFQTFFMFHFIYGNNHPN